TVVLFPVAVTVLLAFRFDRLPLLLPIRPPAEEKLPAFTAPVAVELVIAPEGVFGPVGPPQQSMRAEGACSADIARRIRCADRAFVLANQSAAETGADRHVSARAGR